MYAPALAVEHFGHALEAERALGDPASGQLHRARGQAYEVRGEVEPAEADYRAALDAARADGDRGAQWQGLLDLGFAWLARDYALAGIFFAQALTLAEELGDASVIARSLNRLGNWHVNLDEPGRGLELHERALATFRELGDPAGVAETMDFVGVASLTPCRAANREKRASSAGHARIPLKPVANGDECRLCVSSPYPQLRSHACFASRSSGLP
jgi:tetratricopeptide (TPR) repeat protein